MSVIALIVLVGTQVVAGSYLWRVMSAHRRMTGMEAIGMGVALGTAAAVVFGSLGQLLPVGLWARNWVWLVPALFAGGLWWVRRAQHRRVPQLSATPRAELVGVLAGLGLGLLMLWANLSNYPLAGSGDWTGFHQDMVFFEALTQSTSQFSAADSIFMAGNEIRYHWLTYAWVGQLSSAAAAEPFLVLTRVLPLVSLVGSVLVAVAWARSLSRSAWVPTLAALLLVTGGYVGAVYGAILNFDSPSQALTTMWLLALLMGLLMALDAPHAARWWSFAFLMSLAVAGGKFSTIIVAAGGFGALLIFGFVTNASWRARALLLSGAGILAVVIVYFVMVSGSAQAGGLGLWSLLDRASSVQGLNPQTTARGIVAGTALLIVAMAARWAGVVWLMIRPETRKRPETVMAVGLLVVAVSTIALLSGGFNDMWFALAASAPLSVLSAAGVGLFAGEVVHESSVRRGHVWTLWAVTAALVCAVAAAMVWGTGAYAVGGWRWAAPLIAVAGAAAIGVVMSSVSRSISMPRSLRIIGFVLMASVAMAAISRPLYLLVDRVMQPQTAPHDTRTFAPVTQFVDSLDRTSLFTITEDQRNAGAYLRTASQVSDLVATNATYSPLVAALGERRTYISGIHYQAPYGRSEVIPELLLREQQSWQFIDAPSELSAAELCASGVHWVWIDRAKTATHDWQPWAVEVFASPSVYILKLDRGVCGKGSDTVEPS